MAERKNKERKRGGKPIKRSSQEKTPALLTSILHSGSCVPARLTYYKRQDNEKLREKSKWTRESKRLVLKMKNNLGVFLGFLSKQEYNVHFNASYEAEKTWDLNLHYWYVV